LYNLGNNFIKIIQNLPLIAIYFCKCLIKVRCFLRTLSQFFLTERKLQHLSGSSGHFLHYLLFALLQHALLRPAQGFLKSRKFEKFSGLMTAMPAPA